MPTYVYRCQQCGAMLERRQSFQDAPLTECEICSGELRRVLQPVQVIFKGPGFYSTDYRAKSSTDVEPKSTSTNGEDKGSSSESKPSTPAKTEPASSTATSREAAKSD